MKLTREEREVIDGYWDDRKIAHHNEYLANAREHNIGITNLDTFGVRDVEQLAMKFLVDMNLNNIRLKIFDGMTEAYNFYNPRNRMTLAEGCCTYKALLIQMVIDNYPELGAQGKG